MTPTTTTTLLSLRPGDRARVAGFDGAPAFASRLQAMGLLEDEELEVVRVAPLGDPIAVRTAGGQLSLRRKEAECVRVERIGSPRGAGNITDAADGAAAAGEGSTRG
jgi:Fe2+ transport system protein FeoA